MRNWFFFFKQRVRGAWLILTGRWRYWFIANVDKETLYRLFRDEDFNVELLVHRMHPYVIHKIIKMVSASKDDMDMAMMKAKFEAEVEEYKKDPKPYLIDNWSEQEN